MSYEVKEYTATKILKWHLEIDGEVVSEDQMTRAMGFKECIVTFECPHCGQEHALRESYAVSNFVEPGRIFDCGAHVTVPMPWKAGRQK